MTEGIMTADGRICGAENVDYPGEYVCTYPPGHGKIACDEDLTAGKFDHANPKSGAWWNDQAALDPVSERWNLYVELEKEFRRTPAPEVVELQTKLERLENERETLKKQLTAMTKVATASPHPRIAELEGQLEHIRTEAARYQEEATTLFTSLEQKLEDGGAEWSRMAEEYDGLAGKSAAFDSMVEKLKAGELSDGYHTHNELYEYRMVYHAMAAQWWLENGHLVVKSWHHSDGQKCFGGGWFVVVAELDSGQVSNHYSEEHWDVFDVPEVDRPPEYDGHTPDRVLDRLWDMVKPR